MASHMQHEILDISIFKTHIIPDVDDNDDHSFQEQQEQIEYELMVQDQSQTPPKCQEKTYSGNVTTVSSYFDPYSYCR